MKIENILKKLKPIQIGIIKYYHLKNFMEVLRTIEDDIEIVGEELSLKLFYFMEQGIYEFFESELFVFVMEQGSVERLMPGLEEKVSSGLDMKRLKKGGGEYVQLQKGEKLKTEELRSYLNNILEDQDIKKRAEESSHAPFDATRLYFSMEEFVRRGVSKTEKIWLDRMMNLDFKGKEILERQISKAKVSLERGYEYSALKFYIKHEEVEKFPFQERVPIDICAHQKNGSDIVFLLHVVNGVIDELELYTVDGSELKIENITLENVKYNIAEKVKIS